jgi:hypothetical protein
MNKRTRREKALNEVVVREANENLVEGPIGTRSRADGSAGYEYLCECSNLACSRWIVLDPDEYEHVRSNSKSFFVAPGHVDPEIEDVVEQHDSYWIVAKRGDTGEFVALLDPRPRQSG